MRRFQPILVTIIVLALVRVALPKFRNNITTASAGAVMRSELRNLLQRWDSLVQLHQSLDSAALVTAGYRATGPEEFTTAPGTPEGVRLHVLESSATAFAAETHHELLAADARCAIWAGAAPPPIAGAAEGAARCERFFEPLLGRERLRNGLGVVF